jgi:hypothetical protein
MNMETVRMSAMKLYPNFVRESQNQTGSGQQQTGERRSIAARPRYARCRHAARVAGHGHPDPRAIFMEVGDSSLDRQSYVAFAVDVAVTLGLSWLLFCSRPRADTKE